jgi:hypothetical protein
LGALRSRLGANLDAVAFATQGSQTLVDGVLVLDGELALPLWRPVGGQLHMVVPSLQYRALARPSPRHLALFVAGTDALDPYLERGAVHQLVLTVRQTLGPEGRGAALDLSQPIDLRGRALGQPSARLTVRWGALVQLGTLVSLNLHAGGPRLQHVSQQLAVGHRRVSVWAHYLRAAPGADRFIRTVYELSAAKDTRADVGGAAWAHSLMAGGQMAVGAGFSARYAVTFALPKPEASVGAQPLWQSAAVQNIEVAYRSPCECWGISTTLSASPQNFGPTWRMQVLLTVADTRVGI